jgi:hypothetical protein
MILVHSTASICNSNAQCCNSAVAMTMVSPAGQVDMDAKSADYDSLLHREHFGHGHEARVAAGKKVGCSSRTLELIGAQFPEQNLDVVSGAMAEK